MKLFLDFLGIFPSFPITRPFTFIIDGILLRHPFLPLRTAAAMVIAAVALYDFPHSWPSAFSDLLHLASTGDDVMMGGVVKCFSIWITHRQITPSHLPPLLQSVLPGLLPVFVDHQRPPFIRRDIALIVYACIVWIGMGDRKLFGESLEQMVNSWVSPIIATLSIPDDPEGSLCSLKQKCYETIAMMVTHFPSSLLAAFPSIWEVLCRNLEGGMAIFRHLVEVGEIDVQQTSEGDDEGFSSQFGAMWMAVESCITHKAFRSIIGEGIVDTFTFAIFYMQITKEEESRWGGNPFTFLLRKRIISNYFSKNLLHTQIHHPIKKHLNLSLPDDVSAYILDDVEDEETFVLTENLRSRCITFALTSLECMGKKGLKYISAASSRILQTANENDWKLNEVADFLEGFSTFTMA